MKKLLLVGAVAAAALAVTSQARAGVSFSISLGHHFPHAPVVVAPAPVVVAHPVVATHCAPAPVVVYPGHYAPAPVHYVYGHGHRDYHRCDRHCDKRHGHHRYGNGHGYAAGHGHKGSYGHNHGHGLRVTANGYHR